jgi:hypothetical protein
MAVGNLATQAAASFARDGVVSPAGIDGEAFDRADPGVVWGAAGIQADAVGSESDRVGGAPSGDDEGVRACAEREIDRGAVLVRERAMPFWSIVTLSSPSVPFTWIALTVDVSKPPQLGSDGVTTMARGSDSPLSESAMDSPPATPIVNVAPPEHVTANAGRRSGRR